MIFSNQYPSYRRQQILLTYGIYRLILASVLVVLGLLPAENTPLMPGLASDSFLYASLAYIVLCIIGLVVTASGQLSIAQTVVLLLTDLMLQSLILHFWGGVGTGFGNLMLISVGVGSLLLPMQPALLLAAVAASGAVYTEIFTETDSNSRYLFQAALLGVAFFALTLVLQYLTSRVRSTEQLARAQADTILDLRHLNELIVQRMRTGIIVVSAQGAIRLINDAARDLLGMSEKRAFWLPEPLQQRLEHWKTAPGVRPEPLQIDTEHPEVQINFAPLQDTANSDLILFVEDTGRVQQQAQHLKLASLGRLTASIAHEIRNPLGAISHAGQLLAESEHLSGSDQRLLQIIDNHTQRINAIINTILKLSRKEDFETERINLKTFVEHCLEEYRQGQAEPCDVIVQGSAEIEVRIDPNRMKQVLQNLIDNGLRYSEMGTGARQLVLEMGILEDTEQPCLDVKDSGPGVPDDQIAHLFEPFYTTESSGTGLGLYIAKELCEANRARLFYVKQAQGACFRIVFAHAAIQE
ncbi:MAG: sensor histidine kinase [Saccharospirillum sp.]